MHRWRAKILNSSTTAPPFGAKEVLRPTFRPVQDFLTWEEVGHWYGDLERTQRAPSPEVKAKADELTKDLSSNLEKVGVLYNFAATKVNYIARYPLALRAMCLTQLRRLFITALAIAKTKLRFCPPCWKPWGCTHHQCW